MSKNKHLILTAITNFMWVGKGLFYPLGTLASSFGTEEMLVRLTCDSKLAVRVNVSYVAGLSPDNSWNRLQLSSTLNWIGSWENG